MGLIFGLCLAPGRAQAQELMTPYYPAAEVHIYACDVRVKSGQATQAGQSTSFGTSYMFPAKSDADANSKALARAKAEHGENVSVSCRRQ